MLSDLGKDCYSLYVNVRHIKAQDINSSVSPPAELQKCPDVCKA